MKAESKNRNGVIAQVVIPNDIYASVRYAVATGRANGSKMSQSLYLSQCLRIGHQAMTKQSNKKELSNARN